MSTIRIDATEVQAFLEDGDPLETLDGALEKIVEGFKPGAGDSVTITLIIDNDLESDEDEEEEDEDEESSETK